jgi:predicted DNA-binding protein (UPF0251 family)
MTSGGTNKHIPNDKDRNVVRSMTAYGIQQDVICKVLGISKPTLHLHYRSEIDVAAALATSKVAESLFNNATKKMNVSAQMFWLRARGGWRTVEEVNLKSEDGSMSPKALDGEALGKELDARGIRRNILEE